MKLASLDRLQKEGAGNTEMQLARVLAAHKAAMAYAQASEGEHPEGPKSKLGQEMVRPTILFCPSHPPDPAARLHAGLSLHA